MPESKRALKVFLYWKWKSAKLGVQVYNLTGDKWDDIL